MRHDILVEVTDNVFPSLNECIFENDHIHVFFYISNQFISNQGSGFLKITIEYNGLLLC